MLDHPFPTHTRPSLGTVVRVCDDDGTVLVFSEARRASGWLPNFQLAFVAELAGLLHSVAELDLPIPDRKPLLDAFGLPGNGDNGE